MPICYISLLELANDSMTLTENIRPSHSSSTAARMHACLLLMMCWLQSVCLLGYCLFPIDVAAIIAVFIHYNIIRCDPCPCWPRVAGGMVAVSPRQCMKALRCSDRHLTIIP